MDFTFVCPTEIAEFGKRNSEFEDRDAQLLGMSTDTHFVPIDRISEAFRSRRLAVPRGDRCVSPAPPRVLGYPRPATLEPNGGYESMAEPKIWMNGKLVTQPKRCCP